MKKLKALYLFLLSFFCLSLASACGSTPQDIVIYYTTDVHCAVDEQIGYAGLATYVGQEKAKSKNVTLIDAGDAIQGNLIGSLSQGKYIFDVMNKLDYDLFVLGNHEFDYGLDALKERIAQFQGETLSCNISYTGSKENKLSAVKPYSIKSYDSVKVGYVGVTTPTSLLTSNPANFVEDEKTVYSFGEESFSSIVQKNVDECHAKGCKFVVLVTHLGYSESYSPFSSSELIKATTGVDAVIDGHSHQIVDRTLYPNKNGTSVPLVTAGYQMNAIGKVVLKADGKVDLGLIKEHATANEEVSSYINDIKANLEKDLDKVVAKSDLALSITDEKGIRMARNREVGIGDLIADAYREVSGADIGITNGGGIRDNLPEGDLTFGDIKKVLPFNNQLVTVKASGQTILDYLEFTSRKTEKEYTDGSTSLGENGGFAQVSGLKYSIDTAIPSSVKTTDEGDYISVDGPRRVKEVAVLQNGEYVPIDPNKTYTVTSYSFVLVDGGDGANMFKGCEVVNRNVRLDSEALTYYLVEVLQGKVKDRYQNSNGRITIL